MKRTGLALALSFALTFPTFTAWLYFLTLAPENGAINPWQRLAYTGGKLLQFAFPVLVLWLYEGRCPRPGRPRFAGLPLALGFGFAVGALGLALYHFWLIHTPLFVQTPEKIAGKLSEFGVTTPARYLVLGVFISLIHSLLEEYYWRWFVFGHLRQFLSWRMALVVSSLAFMAHHVIVLYVYLPGSFLTAVVPLSLAIAVGGGVWAWFYQRTETIYAVWLSHLLVDGAIFVVGYDLLQRIHAL